MKKIKISAIVLAGAAMMLFYSQCAKKDVTSITRPGSGKSAGNGSVSERSLEDIDIPDDATPEMIRIYNDVLNPECEIAIIANPNFGSFSSNRVEDTYLCGATDLEDDISVILNDNVFTPDASGQWMTLSEAWKDYYDTDVNVEIKSGATTLTNKIIHVPAPHKAAKLGDGISIERLGNTLTWNADPNNTTDNVILYYYLFDGNGDIIDVDGDMLSDDGSYSLDGILSNPDAKRIYFQLISGNTVSTQVNGKKLLFYIQSVDHHKYDILN